MNLPLIVFLAAALLGAASAAGAQVFSEDFDALADGEALSTANTALTYIRIGAGGGSINASSGSGLPGIAAAITQETSSTSLNGIGVQDTLPPSTIYTLAFDLRMLNHSGSVVFGVGSGSSFTNNTTFTTSHGLFWYQVSGGDLQHRTDVWNSTGQSLALGSSYHLQVVANGSGALLDYGGHTLAAGTMDLYVNGTRIADGVDISSAVAADGFRFYSVNGAGFALDNLNLWNSAQAIPEPSTYALLLGAVAVGSAFWRRRRQAFEPVST